MTGDTVFVCADCGAILKPVTREWLDGKPVTVDWVCPGCADPKATFWDGGQIDLDAALAAYDPGAGIDPLLWP